MIDVILATLRGYQFSIISAGAMRWGVCVCEIKVVIGDTVFDYRQEFETRHAIDLKTRLQSSLQGWCQLNFSRQ